MAEDGDKKKRGDKLSRKIKMEELGAVGGVDPEDSSFTSIEEENSGGSDTTTAKASYGVRQETVLKRRYRTLTFRKKKSDKPREVATKKRKRFWTFRFKTRLPGRLRKSSDHGIPDSRQSMDSGTCVCTGYKRTEEHVLGAGIVFGATASPPSSKCAARTSESRDLPATPHDFRRSTQLAAMAQGRNWLTRVIPAPPQPPLPEVIDLSHFNPEEYPTEDLDDILFAERARDIEEGLDLTHVAYPLVRGASQNGHNGHTNTRPVVCAGASASGGIIAGSGGMTTGAGPSSGAGYNINNDVQIISLGAAFQHQCRINHSYPTVSRGEIVSGISFSSESHYSEYGSLTPQGTYIPRTIHTQVDYIHCIVPDLLKIANCSFYWGIMDRYEAERLLENRPEGTFLLRDSAQEEFLFSVSFRRYGRSLHARIEQWNHKFSFDSHDPGVFASNTVCGLIEHYKDPSCCMFFEPMLTLPLTRTFPFSLQHMCRSVICSQTTYDAINLLPLPKSLKEYLRYYHYKQKVRVRRFEIHH